MTSSENASPSTMRSSRQSPWFRVVYEVSPWIPPQKRLLLEEEATATWWWLNDRDVWENSDLVVEFPLNYGKDDQTASAYPLQKQPDRPQRNLPVKYYLGSNRTIYTCVKSRFVAFGAVQSPMVADYDEIIAKLRMVRGE